MSAQFRCEFAEDEVTIGGLALSIVLV